MPKGYLLPCICAHRPCLPYTAAGVEGPSLWFHEKSDGFRSPAYNPCGQQYDRHSR